MHHSNKKSPRPLGAGWGEVRPEVHVDLKLPLGMAMTGGALDFFRSIFQAVHAANRRAGDDGYVALALPDMRPGVDGLEGLGKSALLVGSRAALTRIVKDRRVNKTSCAEIRNMIDFSGGAFEMPQAGKMLMRTRKDDQWSPAQAARRIARLDQAIATAEETERRDRLMATRTRVTENADDRWRNRSRTDAFMKVGHTHIGIEMKDAVPCEGGRILVSTWGLSHPDAPLVFVPREAGEGKVSRRRRMKYTDAPQTAGA